MKLEIGPGSKRIDASWITMSPYTGNNIDIVARWGENRLPFGDETIDLIYASHVLEHIWWHKTISALREAYRILKLGGRLELHVPDFDVIMDAYLTKKCNDGWRKYNSEGDYMLWVNGRIFTYGGKGNTHRSIFNRPYLHQCLNSAGFNDLNIIDSAPIRGDSHGVIDLAVTAIKENK